MQSATPHAQSEESTPPDRRTAISLALRAWKWGFGLSAGIALLNFLGGSKIAPDAGAWAYPALWLENTAEVATLFLPMAVSIIIESHSPGLSLLAQLRFYVLGTVAGWPLMALAHGNFSALLPAFWNLGLCAGWPLFSFYQHRTDLKAGDNAKSTSRPFNQEKRLTTKTVFGVLGYLAMGLVSVAGVLLASDLTTNQFNHGPIAKADLSKGLGMGFVFITMGLGSLLKHNFKGEAPFKLVGLYAGILTIMALALYAAGIHVIRLKEPIPWDLIVIVAVATFIFTMVVIGEKDSRAEKAE